jgi:hypothetical protein
MAYGKRGIITILSLLIVESILIWWVNISSSRTTSFVTAPIASEEATLITYALIGAMVITVLGAIYFKVKPVPANLGR